MVQANPSVPSSTKLDNEFLADVLEGLSAAQKYLLPKYFYDEQGSQLFDQICDLDEYYPYACEMTLLPNVAADLANSFKQPLEVVEFGAGSLHKVQPLLQHIDAIKRFTAIDISGQHLQTASAKLQRAYPELDIASVTHDFTQPIALTSSITQRMGFFPGSTIGNFTPQEAIRFLVSAAQTLGNGQWMLLGVDTQKSTTFINAAYNDRQGVTATFNKNLLRRINKELGANFDLSQFEHRAFYNSTLGRVEMHLISSVEQQVMVADRTFNFAAGEHIHTENSYKYEPSSFEELLAEAGWSAERWWFAPEQKFSMVLAHN